MRSIADQPDRAAHAGDVGHTVGAQIDGQMAPLPGLLEKLLVEQRSCDRSTRPPAGWPSRIDLGDDRQDRGPAQPLGVQEILDGDLAGRVARPDAEVLRQLERRVIGLRPEGADAVRDVARPPAGPRPDRRYRPGRRRPSARVAESTDTIS